MRFSYWIRRRQTLATPPNVPEKGNFISTSHWSLCVFEASYIIVFSNMDVTKKDENYPASHAAYNCLIIISSLNLNAFWKVKMFTRTIVSAEVNLKLYKLDHFGGSVIFQFTFVTLLRLSVEIVEWQRRKLNLSWNMYWCPSFLIGTPLLVISCYKKETWQFITKTDMSYDQVTYSV